MLEKVEQSVVYPLHEAAKNNDYFTVKRLLREGVNPLFADINGNIGSQLARDRLVVNTLQEAESAARAQAYLLNLPQAILLCELRLHMELSTVYGYQEDVWKRIKIPDISKLERDLQAVIRYPVPSFFLKKLCELAHENNVTLNSELMRSLLLMHVRNHEVENVETLLNHGATYSQETLDEIQAILKNPNHGLTPEALQASISIFQLLLARTENMDFGHKSLTVGTYRWTAFRPIEFLNPQQWDDLLHGYDGIPEWAIFAPLTNLFRKVPQTMRMPCSPLATELKEHVRLEGIPAYKGASKAFIESAFMQTADRPLELMAVFMAMILHKSPGACQFLTRLTDMALLTEADYMRAAYSLFMQWSDFIVLAKTKALYTAKHSQYCESLNRLGLENGVPKADALDMVFSTEKISRMNEESLTFSRVTQNHTAILAKSALRDAREWFEGYFDTFLKTLKKNGVDYASQLKSERAWIAVEGVPSLALLCERNIQQHANRPGFFSHSKTAPLMMQASSSCEHERPLRNDAGCSYDF